TGPGGTGGPGGTPYCRGSRCTITRSSSHPKTTTVPLRTNHTLPIPYLHGPSLPPDTKARAGFFAVERRGERPPAIVCATVCGQRGYAHAAHATHVRNRLEGEQVRPGRECEP